jgi:hypothetical protein
MFVEEYLMYAMLLKVHLDPARAEETERYLHEAVVPRTKEASGFVRSIWIGDSTTGYALTLFDSEEHAQQRAGMVSSAPDDPIQIQEVKVYEVRAEA